MIGSSSQLVQRTPCRAGRAAAPAPACAQAGSSAARSFTSSQLASSFTGTAISMSAAVRPARRSAVAAQAAGKDIVAYLWNVNGKDVACPLCKSLRLILNEKTLSFDTEAVDYGSKPSELQSVGMPAIKFVPEDKLIGGLTDIINFLEKKYPEPSLGKTGSGSSPSETKEADIDDLWETFQSSYKSGDFKSVTPKIEKLDKTIQGLGGQFFGQQIVDITDLLLGPRLYHIEVILKKNGAWPSSAKATEEYVDRIRNLPSFQTMKPSDSDVEEFWSKHAGKC